MDGPRFRPYALRGLVSPTALPTAAMRSCRISPVRKRGRELLGGVLFQPLDEPHHVNDHSLMGADANGRDTLCRFDLELNAATIELGYLRSRDDLLADWRCRQMKHVDARSHRTPRSLRKRLIALRAAFSRAMIMTGVANTGGKVASLKRLARCSAVTTSMNEALGPTGIDAMRRHDAPARKSRIVIDDKRATCNACGRRS